MAAKDNSNPESESTTATTTFVATSPTTVNRLQSTTSLTEPTPGEPDDQIVETSSTTPEPADEDLASQEDGTDSITTEETMTQTEANENADSTDQPDIFTRKLMLTSYSRY